ncbi:hypothetical protein Fcan01_16124 [Folsomia candida]|uniref:Uncharacterized protein n=1 Tax=Folsomia candida TaxID=158441 RepID=A0A226DV67_FOLCA|nr:hypothetical protein Fcan01_16124 [Folsomia candida]
MIFTPKTFAWSSLTKPTISPVALLEYEGFSNLGSENAIIHKFSLQRRRNPSPHCWATFAILPENSGFFDNNQPFLSQPCFVEAYRPFQFFIWMTTKKFVIEKFLTEFIVLQGLGLREVVIVDLNNLMETGTHLRTVGQEFKKVAVKAVSRFGLTNIPSYPL